jgi:hypothetical protein
VETASLAVRARAKPGARVRDSKPEATLPEA